jgi:hypothetical protein
MGTARWCAGITKEGVIRKGEDTLHKQTDLSLFLSKYAASHSIGFSGRVLDSSANPSLSTGTTVVSRYCRTGMVRISGVCERTAHTH